MTRNFPFDSDIRQWSHPLMIPLHCLWAKLNNQTRGQFECDVTWFLFLFWFRSFTCTVLLLLHSLLKRAGASFKIGRPSLKGWKKFGLRWQFSWTCHMCIVPNWFVHLLQPYLALDVCLTPWISYECLKWCSDYDIPKAVTYICWIL